MGIEKEIISALDYAEKTKKGIEEKADENKSLSTRLFLIILISTVISPILILLPFGDVYSKYLPALMTASAALASYWLQLRKPQDRWVIYRGAQREIEYQIDQYNFGNDEYGKADDKEKLLADRVSKRALQLHYEWVPFAPKAEEIEKLLKGEKDK